MTLTGMDQALTVAREAVRREPRKAVLHYQLAQQLDRIGDGAGAIASAKVAINLNANFPEAFNLLGILHSDEGNDDRALQSFERAVAIRPDYPLALNNLAHCLRRLGKLDIARDAAARSVQLKPDYALAWNTLGALQRDLGDPASAEQSLIRAATLEPSRRLHWVTLGLIQRQAGKLNEAAQAYQRAIALDPGNSASELAGLAGVVMELGDRNAACQLYGKALLQQPQHIPALLGRYLTLPMIYESVAEIEQVRSQYRQGLEEIDQALARTISPLSSKALIDAWKWNNFLLAYQGHDDCALQRRYGELIAKALALKAPGWQTLPTHFAQSRPDRKEIRVGFASAFFRESTVGQYFRRWMTELDRTVFEVHIYHLSAGLDEVAEALRDGADVFRHFAGGGWNISQIAELIRGDQLDALIYPELGMDNVCYGLAALRLAPLQCAAWGHPVTSGHETIDRFFTSELMEPVGADDHYVERLVRLPGIGTSYPKPVVPTVNRAEDRPRFGLPNERILFLCPQSLFKIHPDNDILIAQVLSVVPDSTLVLFAARHVAVTHRFMQRLDRLLSARGIATRSRVVVLPNVSHSNYLKINKLCDAMLDTLHWSGGNTSLDALAVGLPVVTLPGAFMRGRQSAAMLGILGVPELIARDIDDYVRIARRLGEDAQWRTQLSERIVAGHGRLYDQREPIARLQQFLREEIASLR